MNTTAQAKRGPKEIFEKTAKLQSALRAIAAGRDENIPSRFLLKRMEDRGLVAFETVQTGGRGRPAHTPVLTQHGSDSIVPDEPAVIVA